MDIKHIGRNIAKLRVSRGLSQGDLGKEIGLTPSAISNIENAISYPSVDTLINISEIDKNGRDEIDYLQTTLRAWYDDLKEKLLEDYHSGRYTVLPEWE